MSALICRGCYALGSACGLCSRCAQERSELIRDKKIPGNCETSGAEHVVALDYWAREREGAKKDPERKGDWIQTYSGLPFYILDPRPEEIVIGDIAHALSLLCRFACHCKFHYSVAQHSLYVSDAMYLRYGIGGAFTGLMHDSAEAYISDLPRPIKRMAFSARFKEIEDSVLRVIYGKFQVPIFDYKWADDMVLATEKEQIMFPMQETHEAARHMWEKLPAPVHGLVISEMHPREVEQLFIERFKACVAGGDLR